MRRKRPGPWRPGRRAGWWSVTREKREQWRANLQNRRERKALPDYIDVPPLPPLPPHPSSVDECWLVWLGRLEEREG